MRDRHEPSENQGVRSSNPVDLSPTSVEELPISSPPYHSAASLSALYSNSTEYPPSPAYDESTKLTEMQEQREELVSEHATNKQSTRPTVHYPDEVAKAPSPIPNYSPTESGEYLLSRPSSIADSDYDDSSDYDWSAEEDLVDEQAKFESRMGVKDVNAKKTWTMKRVLGLLFTSLIGSTFLTALLVAPGLIVHFVWYKPHPTDHRRYVKDNVEAWLFWLAANVLISWYLAMIVNILPVFFQLTISASWGHVSERMKTRIEMYDSIKDTIKPLLYAGSGWASWIIIFGHIYDLYNTAQPAQSRGRYTRRLSQVVEFLFFFSLVLCVKRMLSHAFAFSFHRTAYKERIEEVQKALTVIEKLRQYRPKPQNMSGSTGRLGTRTPTYGLQSPLSQEEHSSFLRSALRSAITHGFTKSSPGQADRRMPNIDDEADADIEGPEWTNAANTNDVAGSKGKEARKQDRYSWVGSIDQHSFESPSVSRPSPPDSSAPHRYPPTPREGSPKLSFDDGKDPTLVHAAKVIRSAVLHDARNLGGRSDGLASMSWNVSSSHEAKRLARSIYIKFKDRGRTYLMPSDFYPAFLGREPAEEAFRVFDKDKNGDISRAEIKTTLLRVYKERRFLSRSMRDVGEALKTLDSIILVVAMVILFFISLSIFGVDIGSSLTSVYSLLLAASFIFKNAASNAFDSIMFLFVTHPFDTGDRCFIDEEILVVKKVGLFATVFTRLDGTETYYFNSQLFTKFIVNVRRSGNTFENLTMQVAWRTPLEKIDALEKCLNEWLTTEENRWYEPSTNITLQHIEFQRFLGLTIGIGHNGWDWNLRAARKTAFHAAVQYYCRQLGIVCHESPIPITWSDGNANQNEPFHVMTPEYDEGPTKFVAEEGKILAQEAGRDAKNRRSVLGFLPPISARKSQLTRARKSRRKKAALRAMD